MKVIEKTWKYGTYQVYDEIDPEFVATDFGVRVLPSPYFYDKKLYFELYKRYEPGEKPGFPNGGYEVRNMYGAIFSYDLDQIIIHPAVLKHRKMMDKMARRAEKQEKRRERTTKRVAKESKPKYGKRGRPALDPVEKARKEQLKAEATTRSGGKRGRPASLEPKAQKAPAGGGKRGRPALSPEAKAQKASAKAAVSARSGGKRGRPKSTRRK